MITEEISVWLRSVTGCEPAPLKLAGDASTNSFFRVQAGDRRLVLLICSDPDRLSSHIHMNRFFSQLGLPVAGILKADDRLGVLLMEDLGDRQLWQATAGERDELYHGAVSLLIKLQRGAGPYRTIVVTDAGPYRPPVLGRNRLLWELEFFATHYVAGLMNMDPAAVRAALPGLLDKIRLEPLAYCHRDYHSRNIMLKDGALHLIDLQDARWGHPLYDLASLLSDSYVDLDAGLVSACKEQFYEETAGLWQGREDFDHQFDYVAVQRNIKALGTFAAQARMRGKTEYLGFVPRTRHLLESRLQRPELESLRSALESAGFFSHAGPQSAVW